MRDQRGSLLLAVLPLALLAGGFVLLGTTSSRAYLAEMEATRRQNAAWNEANAALSIAQARIKSSAYAANRNVALAEATEEGEEVGLDNAEGGALHLFAVHPASESWVSRLADGWYQIDAVASVGGRRAQVRSLVRERDPFSRFGAFVNRHPLGIGGSPKGDVHTNRVMQLFYAGGVYEDAVTARDGFEWLVGANAGNTTFSGGVDDHHAEIPMPNAAEIATLAQYGDGAVESLLGGANPALFDAKVTLRGTQYDLLLVRKDGTGTLTATSLPMPPDGVLFVPMGIKALEGTLDARLTVVSTGGVTITNSLRYIDEAGEPAYRNGLSTNPDAEPYEPNPAYAGNAALGVIADSHILYASGVPSYLEVNGFFFSATGRYGLPGLTFTADGKYVTAYDPTFQKQSCRRYGGIATDLRIVSTVVNGSGLVLSGFKKGKSVYDRRLLSEPPPHFLAIDRPLFSCYRVVGSLPGGEQGRGLDGRAVGAVERAAAEVAP